MAERRIGPPLGRILRGVVHRAGVELREGAANALAEIRQPLERYAQQWALDRWPKLRRYEAAQGGRHGAGWNAKSTSANAEIVRDIVKLRDRARDAVRNDALANRIIDLDVVYHVGTGIVAKSATGDTKLDEFIDETWDLWCDQVNLYAKQSLVCRAMFEAGEGLQRRIPQRADSGFVVPLDVEVMEGDFLDHTLTGTATYGESLPEGHYLVQGVEFDAQGRRVAYHLWQHHPGETATIGRVVPRARVRVPAADIAHLYEELRPGQVRGVTALAPVLWPLKQLGLYLDAELERKGTEALVVGVATSQEPGRPLPVPTTTETTGSLTRQIAEMVPGSILQADASSIQFSHPTPTDPAQMTKGFQHRIASGTGIPYASLSSNLEAVNYSSSRYGMIPLRVRVMSNRRHTIIPKACRPVRQWFLDAGIAAGLWPERPGGYPTKWQEPRFEEVDRFKEAQADILEIRGGLRSAPDVLGSRGESHREVVAETKQWMDDMAEVGVSFDSDPRRPQNAAGADYVDPAADPAPGDEPKQQPQKAPADAPPR